MQKEHNTPTIKDVAQHAGVAIGTVSKVINGKPVGESYRKRVEAAIQALNYQVNSYAKGLKTNKTYTIAFIVPNTITPFFGSLTYYISQSLSRHGYRMLLYATDYNPDYEQNYIQLAQQNKVDGIIGLTYNPDLKIAPGTPFVAIDRPFGEGIPCVSSDNFGGGQMAAEKLVELGCRRLAFLRIGSSLANEPNKRKAGFENGCLSKGVPYEMKILEDSDSMEEFRRFLQDHMENGKLSFDGIFCVTDALAYQVIRMLSEMGIRVPEDVQVIGFDGVQMFGSLDYVCSTIVQPARRIADICVDLVLQEDREQVPSLICLPVTYAPGGTTRD